MTLSQHHHLIGTQGTITIGSIQIYVRILDIKSSYGKLRYLVTPVAGSGQQWMEQVQTD